MPAQKAGRHSSNVILMEQKLEYLYSIKQDYLSHFISLRTRLQRQRTLLFVSSIILLALYFMDLKANEFVFFGVKLSSVDISKILFLIPLILTYQFAHYYRTKNEERWANIALKSVIKTIEHTVEISFKDLAKKYPHISSSGTHYSIQYESRFASLANKMMNTVLWFPVGFVFIMGAFIGLKSAVQSGDIYIILTYAFTLILCLVVIVCSRCSAALAYRQSGDFANRDSSEKTDKDNHGIE